MWPGKKWPFRWNRLMPVWFKAIVGVLVGAALGGVLAFGACALVVMMNGGWTQANEKFIVGVLVYGTLAVLCAVATGGILGLVFVLNRQKRQLPPQRP